MKTNFEIEFEKRERFKEMLDEVYPVFEMGYLTFYPSQILEACDPIAFEISLSEFEDENDE